MKEIQRYPAEAGSVCVYADGECTVFENGTEEYASILRAWDAMTEQAIQMPAFGVSIDRITREELRHGIWAEFVFPSVCVCAEMPFERLLLKVEPEYRGFNLIRCNGGKYEGRCYYLDLREGDMRGFYDMLRSLKGNGRADAGQGS